MHEQNKGALSLQIYAPSAVRPSRGSAREMASKSQLDIPDLSPFILSNVRQTGQKLGKGAYGSVEEVEIPGAICAAKKINGELLHLGTPEGIKHITTAFVKECRLMSTLRHPRIVQFLGVSYLPGSEVPSLVMECLDTNLHRLLESGPKLTLAMKQTILLDVAQGLLYLHSQTPPIIHRDLTAKNVLLDSALRAKIGDLGVARIVDLPVGHSSLTMTTVPGNIVYMPPEAIGVHTKYNISLDIFSFGNLALFTVTQIFPGQMLKAATYTDPESGKISALSEIQRREHSFVYLHLELPENHDLASLIRCCLQNRPSDRPTVSGIVRQLKELRKADIPNYLELVKLNMDQDKLLKVHTDSGLMKYHESGQIIEQLPPPQLQTERQEQQLQRSVQLLVSSLRISNSSNWE